MFVILLNNGNVNLSFGFFGLGIPLLAESSREIFNPYLPEVLTQEESGPRRPQPPLSRLGTVSYSGSCYLIFFDQMDPSPSMNA